MYAKGNRRREGPGRQKAGGGDFVLLGGAWKKIRGRGFCFTVRKGAGELGDFRRRRAAHQGQAEGNKTS